MKIPLWQPCLEHQHFLSLRKVQRYIKHTIGSRSLWFLLCPSVSFRSFRYWKPSLRKIFVLALENSPEFEWLLYSSYLRIFKIFRYYMLALILKKNIIISKKTLFAGFSWSGRIRKKLRPWTWHEPVTSGRTEDFGKVILNSDLSPAKGLLN